MYKEIIRSKPIVSKIINSNLFNRLPAFIFSFKFLIHQRDEKYGKTIAATKGGLLKVAKSSRKYVTPELF
ncbi:hypothetical protein [Nostoc sp. UHCC 0252]|uniref:hypothetical protein n=1 Tax=Nostoc sp. UHCC 0252 TaxID=3110241 RepID=UPI002B209F5D|nr:hypothetical protein [Nostoc sp. UHCC 0252]MEA5602865.1 hypothetical protein [Nostoc sp. UHCC 0252]